MTPAVAGKPGGSPLLPGAGLDGGPARPMPQRCAAGPSGAAPPASRTQDGPDREGDGCLVNRFLPAPPPGTPRGRPAGRDATADAPCRGPGRPVRKRDGKGD
ncbi:hypothetical protein GCM10009551_041900 [Nocardiopsis tropica]